MCKLEQLLHILHKSSKRSESKTKINALTHFAYLNTHYKFCVKHYSQCTIFGVEIIKHFALFFAADKKNYATAGRTGRAKYQLYRECHTFFVWDFLKGIYCCHKKMSLNIDRTDLKRIGVVHNPITYWAPLLFMLGL